MVKYMVNYGPRGVFNTDAQYIGGHCHIVQYYYYYIIEIILMYVIMSIVRQYCSCGSVVEHCVSSAKGCGFNSQGTHILKKCITELSRLKASAKCVNVKM